MRRTGLLLAVTLLLSSTVSATYVGTAPGVKDLGEVERGEKRLVNFYVVTDVEDVFRIKPSVSRPQASIYRGGTADRYNFGPSEASQEDVSPWIKFDKEKVRVNPATEQVVSLENGGAVNANEKVSFVLDVPEDAEPGYHAASVNLNPKFPGGGGPGTGVSTFGLTRMVLVFRVPGVAERDLKISHVNGFRTGERKARIDFLLKNNGTVTTRIARAETKIYDQFGNVTGEITSGGMYLEPGDTEVVSTVWDSPEISEGNYRVRGELNYLTGNTFLDSSINLGEYSSPVEVVDTPGEGQDLPWWIVLMVLMILAVLMYSFDIEPLIILVLVGGSGLSYYIMMSDLPGYLILILLLVAGGIVYRRF